jgi:hypothetical protein
VLLVLPHVNPLSRLMQCCKKRSKRNRFAATRRLGRVAQEPGLVKWENSFKVVSSKQTLKVLRATRLEACVSRRLLTCTRHWRCLCLTPRGQSSWGRWVGVSRCSETSGECPLFPPPTCTSSHCECWEPKLHGPGCVCKKVKLCHARTMQTMSPPRPVSSPWPGVAQSLRKCPVNFRAHFAWTVHLLFRPQ